MDYDILNLPDNNIDLIKKAETLKIIVNNACYASDESFKGILLSILNSILGLVGGLALSFRKVTRVFNSLKQTELEEFNYKNIVFLNRLKRANYNDLRKIKILYPEGLNTTYFEVTSKIATCLNAFNMGDRSKSFLDICESISKAVKDKQYKQDIPALQEQTDDVEGIKKLFADYTKCFTTKKLEKEKPFGDLFLNMQEYMSTKELLENNDKHQFQVRSIYRNVEESNDIIKDCIKTVSNDKDVLESITKEDLISISNACMFFAKTVDMYGSSIMDFHTIEHNFVQMLIHFKKSKVLDN